MNGMTLARSVQRDTGPLEPDSGARGPGQSLATMLSQSCNDGLPWAVSSNAAYESFLEAIATTLSDDDLSVPRATCRRELQQKRGAANEPSE